MNKNILKIAYLIGYIIGVFECLTIYLIPVGVICIIISYNIKKFYLMKRDEFEKNSDKFMIWSIAYAFVSAIPGMLCLIYYISFQNKLLNKNTKK